MSTRDLCLSRSWTCGHKPSAEGRVKARKEHSSKRKYSFADFISLALSTGFSSVWGRKCFNQNACLRQLHVKSEIVTTKGCANDKKFPGLSWLGTSILLTKFVNDSFHWPATSSQPARRCWQQWFAETPVNWSLRRSSCWWSWVLNTGLPVKKKNGILFSHFAQEICSPYIYIKNINIYIYIYILCLHFRSSNVPELGWLFDFGVKQLLPSLSSAIGSRTQ